MPGSIDTRSAASGWNDGLSVNTKRATLIVVISVRLPVPPAPMLPPLITVTPGLLLEVGLVRVADEEDERALRRVVLAAPAARSAISAGLVDHHHVDLADQRRQPLQERRPASPGCGVLS